MSWAHFDLADLEQDFATLFTFWSLFI